MSKDPEPPLGSRVDKDVDVLGTMDKMALLDQLWSAAQVHLGSAQTSQVPIREIQV